MRSGRRLSGRSRNLKVSLLQHLSTLHKSLNTPLLLIHLSRKYKPDHERIKHSKVPEAESGQQQCSASSNFRPFSWLFSSSSAHAHTYTASFQPGSIATNTGEFSEHFSILTNSTMLFAYDQCLFSQLAYNLNICRPLGTFWRAARIGERLSPYVSLCCVAMAVSSVKTIHVLRERMLIV